jgi:hypothetical protein
MTTDRVAKVLLSMAGLEQLLAPATEDEKRKSAAIGAAAVRECSARRFRRRLGSEGERQIVAHVLSKRKNEFDAAVREAIQHGEG